MRLRTTTLGVLLTAASIVHATDVDMGWIEEAGSRRADLSIGDQHLYRISVPAGLLTIEMHTLTHGLDPFIVLETQRGHRLGLNDDGGEGLNSRLRIAVDAGAYVIRAHDRNNDDSGTYTISVEGRFLQRSVRVNTHPNPYRKYYGRLVEAERQDSTEANNGYLWQIDTERTSALRLPPLGEDWWTIEPRFRWVVSEGGTWYLHSAAIDLDGDIQNAYHRAIHIIDNSPDIVCTNHRDPTLVYPFPNVSIRWTESGIDTIYALIDDHPLTAPNRENARAFTASPVRFLSQRNGTHYVHVRGSDDIGTLGPVAHLQINIGRESTPAPPGAPRVVTSNEDRASASIAGETTAPNAEVGRPLAVLDFAAQGIDTNASILLSAHLRDALVRSRSANVYERSRVDLILREQGFNVSGCVAAACAVEIGQLVGLEQIIVGEVGRLGEAYLVSARLIDVETGRVISTASSPGTSSPEALLRYLPSMAWTLMSGD